MRTQAKPTGSVVYRPTKSKDSHDYTAAAKWRDSTGRQHYRRIGKAWIDPDGAGGFRKRRGRAREGYLDQRAANRELDRLIEEAERELGEAQTNKQATVADLAVDFLDHAEHTKKVKPSTLREWQRLLEPPRALKQGNGETDARIMRVFADAPAASVTTEDVRRFLRELDHAGLSARNVNVHRQVLASMFEHATEALALKSNPVRGTKARRENYDKPPETFTAEEVLAIARAARAGAHLQNGGRRWASKQERDVEQEQTNAQDAALYVVAGFTGLRQGELRALRWRNVRFDDRTLLVVAGMSATVESTTKSGKWRAVPLAREPFVALDELSRRETFVEANDYVFCGPTGEPLSSSALYRRYVRARDAADAPKLPFHHLRHTFATLAIRGLDPATVQTLMGHSKITTTERYLHARPMTELAERMDAIFGTEVIETPSATT